MAKNQTPATSPAAAETMPVEQAGVQETPATPEASESPAAMVKARALRDSEFGRVDEVVEVPADQLERAVKSGCVDPHPEAVAYAESLNG